MCIWAPYPYYSGYCGTLFRTCLISCHAVCAKCSRITWRLLQKCLALYLISTWMRGAEPHNEMLNPRSPKQTNKPTQLKAPVWQRIIHPVDLEMGVEETYLRSLPANGELRQRGVSKGRKNPHCLQGMTHTVHKRFLVCCLQPTHTHTEWRVIYFYVSTNIKMHTSKPLVMYLPFPKLRDFCLKRWASVLVINRIPP